ncbi:type I 3-dehydroquinate dehydratase [Luteolibacter luteus]|uniref:3-dehydroquinate dehydratase n=1 Tax=Luteolibacter luteus TaxID=2728835 RepID=A0A858RKX0_9BACT|nr:type I 3-dehydroquinate dehydratase [Luteolibacter luteus]QJE97144.1 type I 3-dehydroquinate dehydratase [Luteolibacter luteus]
MSRAPALLNPSQPKVVGSFGNAKSLGNTSLAAAREACDVVEIRMDLLEAEGILTSTRPWAHLEGIPLLFTARIAAEGGAGNLGVGERIKLLEKILPDAALVDVELASAGDLGGILSRMKTEEIPWVASFHDFQGLADTFARIPPMAEQAVKAGAACFKAAVRMHTADDVAKLAGLLKSVEGIPLSLMGMGPLAPVSRLLCAQYGSVLNYGFIGDAPTAPGQWSAELLKRGIAELERI